MTLRFLIEKEFKQLLRDPFLPKLIVMLPIVVMMVFPWATTMEIKNVNVSVLDRDMSDISRRFVDKVASTSYFNVTDVSLGHSEAMQSVELGQTDMIIEIPKGFERELLTKGESSISIEANAVNGNKSSVATSYITQIIMDYASELSEGRSTGLTKGIGGISIDPYYKFNPAMDYKIPMIPALIVLIMTLIIGFLPSENIVAEKEKGTIEQINVTPVYKVSFILGKLIPYWIIGVVVLGISALVTMLCFGLVPASGWASLFLVSVIYIFSISGLGLIISNYSSSLQQAMFLIFFFIIIFLLMSGMFTPVSSMPIWAQVIAYSNPLTYYTEIMRSIYLKGSSLNDVRFQLYALVGFFVVLTTWAILSYRKRS
ncbi:MAG: ABC transporter permease [Bacteroidales bacterium]|nr:ABC transporter permease [Bacteroidales bacterium]